MRGFRLQLKLQTMMGLIGLFGLLFAGAGLLAKSPSIWSQPVICRRYCAVNLHQIALAMQSYHLDYGCYPPAFLADAQGKPMHSWRVLLLPYLDAVDMYNAYNFSEPWNGPNNRKVTDCLFKVYQCPERKVGSWNRYQADYAVIVGPKTVFPVGASTRDAQITDGAGQTILIVEVANANIHWAEPRDLVSVSTSDHDSTSTKAGIAGHTSGVQRVVLVDGTVRDLDGVRQPNLLRALTTVSGGESPSAP